MIALFKSRRIYLKQRKNMALINCPECSKRISDQSTSCINCGFPIVKSSPFKSVPPPIPTNNSIKDKANLAPKKLQVSRPTRKDSFSRRNIMILVSLLCAFIVIFELMPDTTKGQGKEYYEADLAAKQTQPKIDEAKANYEHLVGGNFDTMNSCLSFIAAKAGESGAQLEVLYDTPKEVSGVFNNDAKMFFYCKRKETGTDGTAYEAAYPELK